MAQLGGGAEAHANSSLVLTTDSHTHEPTGEPVSLHGNGRIDPRTFGDRAYRGRPAELDDKLTKSDPGQPSEAGNVRQSKKRRLQEESVLTSTEEGVYQPKTQEEAMLSVIQQFLGRQPLNVDDSGAADELLAMLKNQVAEDEVVVFSVWNGEADEVVEHGSGWYDGWYEYDGFSLSHHTPSILQAPQEVGGCM